MYYWAPKPPELQQWKNLIWCTVENVDDFSWNLLRPFSLEIEGRKSAKNFAKLSPHFSPSSCKNFARTSLWGIAGTMYYRGLGAVFIFQGNRESRTARFPESQASVTKSTCECTMPLEPHSLVIFSGITGEITRDFHTPRSTFGHFFGPLGGSQSLADKEFWFLPRGICGGFSMKCLVATFSGNWGTKIGTQFCRSFATFFIDVDKHVDKQIRLKFALGTFEHVAKGVTTEGAYHQYPSLGNTGSSATSRAAGFSYPCRGWFWGFDELNNWKGAKGIPTKGIGKTYWKSRHAGYFQGIFGGFQGIFRVISGCSSLCLSGYALWTLLK